MAVYIDLEKLKKLMDSKRFQHTIGVAETAVKMAEIFNVNIDKARMAALLHDCARVIKDNKMLELAREFNLPVDSLEKQFPILLHGKVGAELARKEFSVTDDAVLNAVRRHTLGDEEMTLLDKIIFLADMVEPGRDYPGVDKLRRLAVVDIDNALLAGFNSTISYVISRNCIIHPKSIMARNAVLMSTKIIQAGTIQC